MTATPQLGRYTEETSSNGEEVKNEPQQMKGSYPDRPILDIYCEQPNLEDNIFLIHMFKEEVSKLKKQTVRHGKSTDWGGDAPP